MKILRLSAVALLLSVTLTGSAAPSKQYADFAKGPFQYLITIDEAKQWSAIKTDEQAKQFIDLFWARRDPTPATAVNEFKNAMEERARVADTRFGTSKLKGSATDRGKAFIALGSPSKIRRTGGEPQKTIQTPTGTGGTTAPSTDPMGGSGDPQSLQEYSGKELWEYIQGEVKIDIGQPVAEVAFIDQYASNEYKMERVARTDYKTLFDRVARKNITQPNLTEVPVYSAAETAAAAAVAAAPAGAAAPVAATVAATNALTSEALRSAVTAARSAKAPETLYLTTGEFITPEGKNFVPVQLWAPKSAGLTAGSDVTFFGAVENADGTQQVVSYEEPVKLIASNDDVFYARSLELAPGTYRATFGLAKDGKPISVVSKPLVVKGLSTGEPGISQLMLSSHIYPLTEAQAPTDPFAFGGLKVVPRGNATFHPSDELWYFMELRDPGKDATGQPKLTMAVTIAGVKADGKKTKMIGPSQEVPAQELKGVPGHYGVGQAMPLATFKPGTYTMTVKLTDTVLAKTYELQEPFTIVE
jgi:GWxTD domain-containing protein